MNLFEILLEASIVVQAVMLLLLGMSLYVWILIFAKIWQVKKIYRLEKKFYKEFNNQTDLLKLYKELEQKDFKKLSPMENIFTEGFKEYAKTVKSKEKEVSVIMEYIQGKMRQVFNQQMNSIENRVSMLATIGSSAPYIGLFGTVWGIINAFQALRYVQHATLTLVAPGISEALIATAMGLFVAIPSVIGYNRFLVVSDNLAEYYEQFIDDFSVIIKRQLRLINQQ